VERLSKTLTAATINGGGGVLWMGNGGGGGSSNGTTTTKKGQKRRIVLSRVPVVENKVERLEKGGRVCLHTSVLVTALLTVALTFGMATALLLYWLHVRFRFVCFLIIELKNI
jgi:hypothetical protein